MAIGYIYKYTYPNGKVYIGQTRVSVEARHKQHMWVAKNDADRRSVCECAIAKYGEPILETVEVIEVDDANITDLCKKLDDAEMKWISYYNSTDTTKGYNVMGGGTQKTPDDFILQEKWYEIFENEGWANYLNNMIEKLNSIGEKICLTKEKLTKEERNLWYGYKFRIIVPEISVMFGTTTFNAVYKSVLNNNQKYIVKIIKNQDYPGYEHLEKCQVHKSNDLKVPHIDDNRNKPYVIPFPMIDVADFIEDFTTKNAFDDIIEQTMKFVIEDIRQNIWQKVMKHKDKIIKEWYTNKG